MFPWIVVLGFSALYAWHIPLSVTLEDSGELLMVASDFGVAHPPGYPLFGMIGGLFSRLPTGNLALNVHLMSLTFGAITLYFLYRISERLAGAKAALYGVALAAAAPTVVWYFTVAEVYSMFTAIFFACFHLVLSGRVDGRLFFLAGLGMCAHWPLFVLCGPALILANPGAVKQFRARHLAAFALGLLPFVFLWWRSKYDGYLVGGRLESLSEIIELISRRWYRESDHAAAVGWRDEAYFAANSMKILARNFAWAGLVFPLYGIFRLWRAHKRAALALVWLIFGCNLLMRAFLRVEYDVLFAEELESFHVVPLLALGPAAAAAFQKWPKPAAMAAVCAGVLLGNFPQYERGRKNTFARELAAFYLSAAPPGAVFLGHGDSDLGPLAYVNRIEGVRPDVTVWSQTGFLIRPEGVDRWKGYPPHLIERVRAHLEQNKPVVAIRLHPHVREQFLAAGLELPPQKGPLMEVALPGRKTEAAGIADPLGFLSVIDRLASGEIRSGRWRYYQEALVGPLCWTAATYLPPHPVLDTGVYCRYFKLKHHPPADAAAAEGLAREIWQDARFFQDDERAVIRNIVSRYWTGVD